MPGLQRGAADLQSSQGVEPAIPPDRPSAIAPAGIGPDPIVGAPFLRIGPAEIGQVGVVVLGVGGQAGRSERAAQGGPELVPPRIAAGQPDVGGRALGGLPGHDVDHGADRVFPVERGAGSVGNLDPVDVAQAQIAAEHEVLAAGWVDAHAVEQHDDLVVANDAPDRHGGSDLREVQLGRLHSGKIPKNVLQESIAAQPDLLLAQHHHRGRRVGRLFASSRDRLDGRHLDAEQTLQRILLELALVLRLAAVILDRERLRRAGRADGRDAHQSQDGESDGGGGWSWPPVTPGQALDQSMGRGRAERVGIARGHSHSDCRSAQTLSVSPAQGIA